MPKTGEVQRELQYVLRHYADRSAYGYRLLARVVNNFVPPDAFLEERIVKNWFHGNQKSISDWRHLIAIAHVLHMKVSDVEGLIRISKQPSLEQLHKQAEEPFLDWIEILLWQQKRLRVRTRNIMDAAPMVANLTVASGEPYEWHKFTEGLEMYIDRPNTRPEFTYISNVLREECVLITANNDKHSSAKDLDFISFIVNQDAIVYVIYTTRNTLLEKTWLSDGKEWSEEDLKVVVTLPNEEAIRKLRSKQFTAGTRVELGGNGGTDGATSMYHVVVVPIEKI